MKTLNSTNMKTCRKSALLFVMNIALFCSSSMAQDNLGDDRDGRGDRLQTAKVAFINTKLNLTTTQAQQFWPLFNEFEAAKKKIRKQLRQLKADNLLAEGTDEALKGDIKKMFSLRQEELDLEKGYSEKFLKVISAKQLVDFYRSEKEFTRLILRKLRERRGGHGGGMGEE